MKTMDLISEILIRLVNTIFIQQNNCYSMMSAVINFRPCLQQYDLPLVKLASAETLFKNKVVWGEFRVLVGTLKENKTKSMDLFLQNTELFMECVLLLDVADRSAFASGYSLLLAAVIIRRYGKSFWPWVTCFCCCIQLKHMMTLIKWFCFTLTV